MTSPSLRYDVLRPEADLLRIPATGEVRRILLPRRAYPIPHPKRTSRSPSPNTAWKVSSDNFVFCDLHRGTELPEVLRRGQFLIPP